MVFLLPKPFPPNPTAKQQATELRDAVERLEIHFRAQLTQTETQLRGADRDNLRRYAEANKILAAATPQRVLDALLEMAAAAKSN